MDDRTLLEMAAKAAGIDAEWYNEDSADLDAALDGMYLKGERTPDNDRTWNPLRRDGDALRLAVKLQLQITPGTYNKDEFSAFHAGHGEAHERWGTMQDEYAATRRAIVRAAAEIGKAKGES